MADLHARFRSFDRVTAPDLWAEIEERATAAAPEPLTKLGLPPITGGWADEGRVRTLRLVVLLALLVVTLLVLVLAFGRQPRVPTTPLVFTTSLSDDGTSSVVAIDVSSGKSNVIVESHGQRIHVSPDGRWAFFEGIAGDEFGLVLARTDGSGSRPLADPGEYEVGRVWESVWAPDSHAVTWLSWSNGRPTLMVADVPGTEPRAIDIGAGSDPHLVWSPDSSYLASVDWGDCEGAAAPRLLVVDTRTGAVVEVGDRLDVNTLPAWSHDGHRVAVPATIGNAPLTPQPDVDGDPNTIECVETVGQRKLVVYDTETGATSEVDVPIEMWNLAWSTNDETIHGLTADALYEIPTDGGPVTRIADVEGGGGVWSPDAVRLAWFAWDGGSTESSSLWVLDEGDSVPRRVAREVDSSGVEGWPMWSPDGEWLAFHRGPHSSEPGANDGSIWIVRPDGSDMRLLVDGSLDPDLSGVDW